MRSGSIVKESFSIARQSVQLALLGALFVIACLLAERFYFHISIEDATTDLINTHKVTNQIRLADERLTLSANMAIATGQQRWINRYQKNVPLIDQAIQAAIELAPAQVSTQFIQETRLSNDKLIALEEKSFQAISKGNKAKAQQILDGPQYSEHKTILADGTKKFIDSTVHAMTANIAHIENRSLFLLLFILTAVGVSTYLLLRRLNISLTKTETAYIDAEHEIRYLANTDTLTGLANRFAFQQSLQETLDTQKTLDKTEKSDSQIVVMMLDLDRFKPINDRYGHLVGDLVLKEVATRIRQILGSETFFARYGGDEFVLYFDMKNIANPSIHSLCDQLIRNVSAVMIFEDIKVQVGTSIGMSLYPKDANDPQELVRKADIALYNAKENGRNTHRFYEVSMDADLNDRTLLEADLREAVATHQITPYFQPIVCLETGAIKGFEILSRWHHPERGPLAPAQFISLAESIGIVGDLTSSVLRQACEEAHALPAHCFIAMNIAPEHMAKQSLEKEIQKILQETQLPPHRLEVELTETALVSDFNATRKVISNIKNLGIKVALDDFGTGYSSLNYLSELNFDKLKIDRSFITNLHKKPESEKIVRAIIGLGQSFHFDIVAEGIETEEEAKLLSELGCSKGQGYFYSKPIPAKELPALIAQISRPKDKQPQPKDKRLTA